MRFEHPLALFLLPVVLAGLFASRRWRAARRSSLSFPGAGDVRLLGGGRRARLVWLPAALRVAALTISLVALARPQFGEKQERLVGESIDIMMCLDVSGSMRAEDFQPENRLFVAKAKGAEFVRGRRGDRTGLVVFAGDAFTKCPLTRDFAVVSGLIENTSFDDVADPNATAIGMALATGANRLKASEAKSKVIILLTDGINNAGAVDPLTAAELCRSLGIKIYTIGVGSREDRVPFPGFDAFGRKRYVYYESRVDEEALTKVASTTGGLYFRATDPAGLEHIYERIDEMEKTQIETEVYVRYAEAGPPLVAVAFVLLLAELLLSQTYLAKLWE